MSTEYLIKFRTALTNLFQTPDGELVLKYLKESYVDNSAFGANTEQTMYNLGQKELVQGIIRDSSTDISELQELINKGGLLNE